MGQTGDYITLADGALYGEKIDATGVSFGASGVVSSVAEGLAVEDKITHAVDDPSLGFIRVMADNVFVTQASGSIQRGIDVADAGDTVNVGNGTSDVSAGLTIGQQLNLRRQRRRRLERHARSNPPSMGRPIRYRASSPSTPTAR